MWQSRHRHWRGAAVGGKNCFVCISCTSSKVIEKNKSSHIKAAKLLKNLQKNDDSVGWLSWFKAAVSKTAEGVSPP